jgi:hypothetical protein
VKRGVLCLIPILILLTMPVAAKIDIFSPKNLTYDIPGTVLTTIIDYNISDIATRAWISLNGTTLNIRNNDLIEYFELNNTQNNPKISINNNISNMFVYTFTARASGRGIAHIYLKNNNISLIDIMYLKGIGTGDWSCQSNGGYKRISDAFSDIDYRFTIKGYNDGASFTNYSVSINGNTETCQLPIRRLVKINKIDVTSNDTTISLSAQRMLAGSYFVDLPIGSYLMTLNVELGGQTLSKSAQFLIRWSSTMPVCSDGTQEGSCSSTRGKYCYRATLIDNCLACGCASGTCNSNGFCVVSSTVQTTTSTLPTATTEIVTTTVPINQTTTTQPVILENVTSTGVGKYYVIIVVLLSFFIVILFLLRKDLDRLKN